MSTSREEVLKMYNKMVEEVRAESEEAERLYSLYKKMTPSMQKAIVDIMKTVNGMEIDDEV